MANAVEARDEGGPDDRVRTGASESLVPDPVIEAYKAGVDRSILRQNLRRSVEERIAILQEMVRLADEFARARQIAGRHDRAAANAPVAPTAEPEAVARAQP